jgi:plastocyanin
MKKLFLAFLSGTLLYSCTYDISDAPQPYHNTCDTVMVTIHATSSFSFSPQSVQVGVGDTIKWVYDSDNQYNHTTTSGVIPSGATTWDAPLTATDSVFIYVVTEEGTYNYVCTPHAPGMGGTITVLKRPPGC